MNRVSVRSEPIDLSYLDHLLRQVLRLARPHNARAYLGGYFCVSDAHCGTALAHIGAGSFPACKAEAFIRFAREKNARLADNRDHVSSFQSKNASWRRYPGAVRLTQDDLLFSFSGLDALLDEAISTTMGMVSARMSDERAAEITKISKNPFTQKMLDEAVMFV